MFVVMAEEWIIPGKRIEVEQVHQESAATLRAQPGFVSGRLLHFSGGPYRYCYETTWESREDWERFWDSPAYATYRAAIDQWLSAPHGLLLYDVKSEA